MNDFSTCTELSNMMMCVLARLFIFKPPISYIKCKNMFQISIENQS